MRLIVLLALSLGFAAPAFGQKATKAAEVETAPGTKAAPKATGKKKPGKKKPGKKKPGKKKAKRPTKGDTDPKGLNPSRTYKQPKGHVANPAVPEPFEARDGKKKAKKKGKKRPGAPKGQIRSPKVRAN
jgi:hypothetical protein